MTHDTEIRRRAKISQTLKGRMPKNLQLLHTLPRTKAWRDKIGLKHKGKRLSEETKRKISEAKRNPLKPLYVAIRACRKTQQWRTAIFKRDNYTCVLCRTRGCELNADHYPKRFVDHIRDENIQTMSEAFANEELWNIRNGRTLCEDCHKKTDTWGNRFRG